MKRFCVVFITLFLGVSHANSEVLTGYDAIEDFQLTDSGWLSSVAGTEFVLLENPTAVASKGNVVFFIDSGLNALYAYDMVSQKASTLSSAYSKIDGNVASLYISRHLGLFIVDPFGGQVLKFDLQGDFFTSYEDSLNLNTPVGMCVNPTDNHVFIADGFYGHIIEFNQSGDPLALHGIRTRGQTQAGNNIIGMTCTDEEMFIVSKLSKNINVFSYSGDLIRQIPRPEVHNPTAVAVDKYNRVYISDAFDDRIRVYDGTRMIAEFGGAGLDALSFRDIKGLWVENSLLYVADSMNRRVQILTINHPSDGNPRYAP